MPKVLPIVLLVLVALAISPLNANAQSCEAPEQDCATGASNRSEIPAGNRADLREAPTRPAIGDFETRLATLMRAIAEDRPELAVDVFLPREAFALVKAVDNPTPVYDRLIRLFHRDIHALHAQLQTTYGARLSQLAVRRLQFSSRRAWVRVREEAHRLPYWAQRHNTLVVGVNGMPDTNIELRVAIAWDNKWFITHLADFH